ncbi:MAG: N-6 DNA methylase [Ruminococcus sp.]|nr:N-6 DNA methylase [Ruminococcus sp.]
MIGAIIGDIVGSRFEWNNIKSKDFDFLTYKCFPTDDSVMTLALAQAILISKPDYSDLAKKAIECMQLIGRNYPDCGYGGGFQKWMFSDDPKPYNSYGNGAAMRVSAAGFAANSIEEAKELSRKITEVTHNHPEGIKGAEATAVAIYMAKTGSSLLEIRDYIDTNYYPMDFTLDGIRATYKFNETCQDTVPQALMAFFESTDFEDAIRNAISIGGDSDTLAAICGGVAEAYYGVPAEIRKHALTFLDQRLLKILVEFENKYSPAMEKKVGGVAVPVERKLDRLVNGSNRETLIENAAQAADDDVENAESLSEETTSKQLFNHLFEACNILRGPINQDEYKSYVTPILFFKRISDVYDEEYEEALAFSGGDVEYAEADEMHSFVIPNGCHWDDVRNVSENVGKAIVNAMTGIEKANPDTLSGVFSSFDDATWTDKNKLTDERLKNLIEHMSLIKVGNKNYSADIMGDSYEYLIKKFADLSKKNAGEFYTPRPIVKLMVKLLDPKPGDTVYDPACGTGGMLIEAIHHMNNDRLAYGRIFGQENNLSTSAIARMNLYLHGAKDVQVKQGDTLRNPLFLEKDKLKSFDCVLANPPFGLEKWGAAQFEYDKYGRNMWGCPTDASADYAWLQHMVRSMDSKNGRCAVVLPQGILFGKYSDIREKLIRSDMLEAVIALAGGVFYSTPVSACILFLTNKKKKNHVGRVCLIDATEIYTSMRAQNILTQANVDDIFKLYTDYIDVVGKCKVVTIKDLEAGEFELNVKKYIEQKRTDVIDPEVALKEYHTALTQVKEAEDRMYELLVKGGYVHE